MSLTPSAGTPGADCQEGLGYPPEQVEGVAPSEVMQLLLPPPPATVWTAPEALGLLQLASAEVPAPTAIYAGLVQLLFQTVSGM